MKKYLQNQLNEKNLNKLNLKANIKEGKENSYCEEKSEMVEKISRNIPVR